MTHKHHLGLDLGPPGDYSAWAVLEEQREERHDGVRPPPVYHVRHLERFVVGTGYPEIFQRLRETIAPSPLAGRDILVDITGVGVTVFEALRKAGVGAHPRKLVLTATGEPSRMHGVQSVPKLDLIGNLQLLLQNRRLKVAPGMNEASTLLTELTEYRLKPVLPGSGANDPLAWRERPHDDLVFAVGLAAWQGERGLRLDDLVECLGFKPLPQSPWRTIDAYGK